jgi:hypothetical protein
MRWMLVVVGVALLGSSDRLVARSQTASANGIPLASLPDNPCDLLTSEQVAVATGLEVTEARHLPSIRKIVQAQNIGGEPEPGTICSYETRSEFGAVTVVVPPHADRSAASYWQDRERAFSTFPMSARMISGVGEDAWLGGGTGLHVLTRQGEYFMVGTQMYSRRSADLLVALARGVLDRLR